MSHVKYRLYASPVSQLQTGQVWNTPTFPLLLHSGAQVCVHKEPGGRFWAWLSHHAVVRWLRY